MTNSPYRSSSTPLYAKLKILKFKDLRTLEVAKVMHQHSANLLPRAFDDYFIKQSTVHSHRTRSVSRGSLFVRRCTLKRTQNSLRYLGVKIWNDLPLEIKKLSYPNFKSKLKSYLSSFYHSSWSCLFIMKIMIFSLFSTNRPSYLNQSYWAIPTCMAQLILSISLCFLLCLALIPFVFQCL